MNRALRAATIGVLLIAPVALSSCSAGQIPQTSTQNRDKVGAMGTSGAIALREVKLPFPTGRSYSAGGDAELTAAIVNGGSEADQLVSITGDDFSGVRVAGTGTSPLSSSSSAAGTSAATSSAAATTSSAATGTAAAGTSSTAAGQPTAATGIGGATGTPTSTASSSSAGTSLPLTVPPDMTLFLGQNSPHVFLTGLSRSLTAGQVVRVTFTFQRAGAITVDSFVSGPTAYVPNSSSFNFELPTRASEPGVEAGGGGVSGGNG